MVPEPLHRADRQISESLTRAPPFSDSHLRKDLLRRLLSGRVDKSPKLFPCWFRGSIICPEMGATPTRVIVGSDQFPTPGWRTANSKHFGHELAQLVNAMPGKTVVTGASP